ncbi:NtaA/DmoA family FMN-dependent monooxygenase [Nitrospirillum iridis]|uniref:FMN-dependent oxidoreductase (Nitrilotriacetate monooxygenase family) n=1 Tax=Nitrospirillum iridis TaxID=765888 RepID=A0A7X0B5Y5_9PROT|nr:NtaA/DmoA family FMN-dependent monooxygenase [Nitrospirillum iridis]MBB6255066.1 FMN-dependent oxidoreductase (nitrilotriacetate monooxygenase family) [Nitrospirillum iridis]
MSRENGRLHLWAFLQGIGFFPGGWREERATPDAVFQRAYYERIARLVEDARFDAIVFGDQLQGRDAAGRTPGRLAIPTLDPFTLLAVMAGVTSRVGLVATVSTTYNEPAEVAAKFAALNFISDGRAGWNIVTTVHPNSPWNFGEPDLLEKSARYARAQAFVDAADAFWRQAAGHPAANAADALRNQWFDIAGTLDFPTSPQYRPVLVQAGQSPDGRNFAAQSAEAIFCPAPTIDAGRAYRDDIHERARALGRDPSTMLIMPGLAFILGDTEEEARRKHHHVLELADDQLCIEYLSESIGYDLTRLPANQPFPLDEICAACEFPAEDVRRMLTPAVEAGLSIADACRDYARKPRGHAIFVGTPEQMADRMETWIDAGACDGFTLQPGYMPSEIELFCAHVTPLLQRRGLLRREYQGPTLRDHLGGDFRS